MVVAHRVIDVADGKNLPKGIRETDQFPVLKDNGKMVQGEKEILRYLEEYKKLKDEWDKFQSDACYCDDEGNIE